MARFTAPNSAVIVPLLLMVLLPTGNTDHGEAVQAMRVVAPAADASSVSSPDPLPSSASSARTTDAAAAVTDDDDASTISSAEVCVDAGYLCSQLEQFGSLKVLRFPSELEEISVHVPLPTHEPEERARALRDAAIAGLAAWDSRPFLVRFVDPEDFEGDDAEHDVDLVVRWEAQLPDGGLGETRSTFRNAGGVPQYAIAKLVLATRNPYDPDLRLEPVDVELTAAHEMGHALGLPHSDHRGDLMYPTDAATTLSERDFHTLEALYRIPNGTTIVMEPAPLQ